MATVRRSIRQEQKVLAEQLRAQHYSWPQIAEVFQDRYRLNARAGLRMARGWSQRDAADRWNSHWPTDPKTFKNFSYWEQWPAATGHAPSLDVLTRLAELYECRVADLLTDCADFRLHDSEHKQRQMIVELTAQAASSADRHESLADEVLTRDVDGLAALATRWIDQLPGTVDRQALLLKLSAALSLAAASHLTPAAAPTTLSLDADGGLTGIWHSRYVYRSAGRDNEFTGEHHVVLRQHGTRLVGQSIEQVSGSHLTLDLVLSAAIATGSWREATSPTGYYQGAVYHGSLQVVADPSGNRLYGRWIGFGRKFTINSGTWEFARVGTSTSKTAQRPYVRAL